MDHNRICDNCGGLINDAAVYHGRFLSHLDASVCFEKLHADLASMTTALAAVHRKTGRGDGHATPDATAACIVGAFIDADMRAGEVERDLASMTTERDTAITRAEAAEAQAAALRETLEQLRDHADTGHEHCCTQKVATALSGTAGAALAREVAALREVWRIAFALIDECSAVDGTELPPSNGTIAKLSAALAAAVDEVQARKEQG